MKQHQIPVAVRPTRGFSLIEILAVLAIIGILIAVAIPMMKGPTKSIRIGSSADLLKGELLLAHQQAMTLNSVVEVRFFQETDSDPYTAYQVFNVDPDGVKTAFSKLRVLPEGVVMPADVALCPMLVNSLIKGTQTDGTEAVKNWHYSAVDIRSSGEFSDLDRNSSFITLIEKNAPKVAGNLPANYAVVRIEPLTGMVSVVRP